MKFKSAFVSSCAALSLSIISTPANAQLAPAGLTVIQNPSGVYYAFYSDSVLPNRNLFFYVNKATQQFDQVAVTLSSNGAFSGTSSTTGRSLTGQVQATSVSLTYNGVSQSGPKESLYGPTRQFGGQWLGWVSDATNGFGFAEFFVSSHGECLVYFLQGFQHNVGVGTIDSHGAVVVPLLSGASVSGTFAPANGGAAGTFNYSTGGHGSYSVLKAVPPRLANISTRGVVGPGEQVLIAGFIITDGGKTVLIKARGPSLAAQGVAGALHNPRLDLYFNGQIIASNSSWQDNANAAEIRASGLAPTDPSEAALQVDLEPGNYTVIVSSEDSTTGVGLVELYGVGSAAGN
jgi:hypothetical protein